MSIGQGVLRMTFAYPSFTRRYKRSRPRMAVDGVEQRVTGWGSEIVTVPAGPHKIRVGVVPLDGGAEEGAAEAAVSVGVGAQIAVEYQAPRMRGSKGALRIVSVKAFGD